MKVVLSVAWLSENELLEKALALLGYEKPHHFNEHGFTATGPENAEGYTEYEFCWDDESLLFSLAQLKELGFE